MTSTAVARRSVLFERPGAHIGEEDISAPDCFADLNLDQIVAAATAGKEEYRLTPFFHSPLHDVDAVLFRHEVMRDLDNARLLEDIKTFAGDMRTVRKNLGEIEGRYSERQKERWFLDAVGAYGQGIRRLAEDLSEAPIGSRGLREFRDFVVHYASSEPFVSLVAEARRLVDDLSAIRYGVAIQGLRVEVRPRVDEGDYSAEVEATFERFRQGAAKDYTFSASDTLEMNHIEAQILDGVARLHQETFERVAAYRAAHREFLDPDVVAFDREIQFYVAYREHMERFERAGLRFCYPRVSDSRKDVCDDEGYDLALAGKLLADGRRPVCNDFHLNGAERIVVVSGPNQGGKTTFARTFGQLHYLASLGCPVPGTRAQLYLPDRIYTHFDREERVTNLRGKLEDDIVRMHEILATATPRSIVIVNEIFASTTFRDALTLSKRIARVITDLDVLGVWVTFLDEVASLSEKTVSMVSTVVPENPAQRTFKVVRRPADGLAYAVAIARKYRLTYEMIKERIRS